MLEDANFNTVKARLDEIADEVARDDISLDDALALYEEAVQLGLRACDISELNIELAEESETDSESEHEATTNSAVSTEGEVPTESVGDVV